MPFYNLIKLAKKTQDEELGLLQAKHPELAHKIYPHLREDSPWKMALAGGLGAATGMGLAHATGVSNMSPTLLALGTGAGALGGLGAYSLRQNFPQAVIY